MAHIEVAMPIEKKFRERFCEMISHVQGSVDACKYDEVLLNPFLNGVVLDVYVAKT
jgi:hypothetical protein